MTRIRGAGRGALVGAGLAVGLGAAGALMWSRKPRREHVPGLRGGPFLVAHRGGAGLYPENTVHAFRRSVEEWASDMIELDVRASADGHCVVIHDPTVDRTTDGSGVVSAMRLAELRELDAGYRFTADAGLTYPFRSMGIRVPTLDEVLEAVPTTRLVVEVKAAEAQAPLLEAVRRAGAESRVVAAGGNERFRTLFAEYRGPISASGRECFRFYLYHRARLGRLCHIPADAVHVPETWAGRRVVTRRFVKDVHERGLSIHVWTVNDPAVMARLLDWGVDGIITDRPDLLARLLTERYGRPPAPALDGTQASRPSLE